MSIKTEFIISIPLQETVDARGDDAGDQGGDGAADGSDQIYISIPEDKWDEFARDFSVQVYNNKADYKRNSLILSALLALLGGVATYFISGHALRPIREFSKKIEEVQAQNLADSRIEENKVKELNQLRISYNKMLERLADAFETETVYSKCSTRASHSTVCHAGTARFIPFHPASGQ